MSRILVPLILLLIIGGLGAGGYFYTQMLEAKLEAQEQKTQRALEVAEEQKVTMERMQADIQKMAEIQQELNTKIIAAEQNVVNLNNKFDTDSNGQARDIGRKAIEDPVKWNIKINRATKDALRCNELVTGAQPLPDEVNGQCPDLVPGSLPTKTEEKVDIRKTVK
jgi:hypothetical protein